MNRHRSSIAMLLIVVGLIGIGLASLRVSSRLWANAMFSLALIMMVVAVAGLIYRQGRRRAFWGGFALFGGSYLALSLGPPPINSYREWLITTPILAILEERLLAESNPTLPGSHQPRGPAAGRLIAFVELSPWSHWTATDRSNPFSSDSFTRIGHSVFCLGIALGGGVLCQFFRDTRDEHGSTPDPLGRSSP